jgi:hypothetical protein
MWDGGIEPCLREVVPDAYGGILRRVGVGVDVDDVFGGGEGDASVWDRGVEIERSGGTVDGPMSGAGDVNFQGLREKIRNKGRKY